MFKSLRWRLQVWHAIVLLIILTIFGAIVYDLHWKSRLQQIDAELDRTSRMAMFQLRQYLPRIGSRRPRDENRQDNNDPAKTERSVTPTRDQPPTETNRADDPTRRETPPPSTRSEPSSPDRPGEAARPNPLAEADRSNRNPSATEFENLFHGDEESRFYFIIWNEAGEVIRQSEVAPKLDFPNIPAKPDERPSRTYRDRSGEYLYREIIVAGADDRIRRNMLIGRPLEKEIAAHHTSGLMLIATGCVILAAGVFGGGWLTSRAIRPIDAMTATAESISAQNLSERINVKDTDSELGKLAAVLNATFDRLQAGFERQKQFTADASHELRTPLSVIATHAELALARPRSNEDYRATIETVQKASKRMRSLIDALLVLARFDAAAIKLKHDRVELESLIKDCVDLVEGIASERSIQIEIRTSHCEVLGDWDRLAQVVTNLLTNAINYNVDGGRIIISTSTENKTAIITVEDNGIGIAEDQLPKIFDRFYQVDASRSHGEGSCGLGLSICKTIVELHGGTIVATSRLNTGTCIEIRLPIAEKSASTSSAVLQATELVGSSTSA